MHKRLVRPGCITAPQADGGDGHPADGGQHKQCVDHHDKGHDQVDCAKSVGTYAPSYKNPVHNGKQEKAYAAQHSGHNIFDNVAGF